MGRGKGRSMSNRRCRCVQHSRYLSDISSADRAQRELGSAFPPEALPSSAGTFTRGFHFPSLTQRTPVNQCTHSLPCCAGPTTAR